MEASVLPTKAKQAEGVSLSTEPALWRRPGWLRAPLLALMWAVLVVYGSLLPWGLDLGGAVDRAGGVWPAAAAWITSPAWLAPVTGRSSLGVATWVSDLVVNLLLYAPLGVLLRLTVSRLTGRQVLQAVAATAALASMSWLIESTQSLMPGRYASLQDVLANSAGGFIGVVVAHRVNTLWRASAFALYRWTAHPLYKIDRFIGKRRRRPVVMFAALAVNAGLIGWWYTLTQVQGGVAQVPGAGGINLVPFGTYFDRSYDVSAMLLGRSMIVYCLAGALLTLPMMRGRTRRALGWVVLAVSLTAAGVEAIKLTGGGARADVTEPMIAMIAAGLVLTSAFMLVHACRCSCRRSSELHVGVDRRRRRHDYRFSLQADKPRSTD